MLLRREKGLFDHPLPFLILIAPMCFNLPIPSRPMFTKTLPLRPSKSKQWNYLLDKPRCGSWDFQPISMVFIRHFYVN